MPKKAKQLPKPPKVTGVGVHLVQSQEPDEDGLFTFTPVFPYGGSPSFKLKARTPEKASRLFCEYVINELDGRDDATEDM